MKYWERWVGDWKRKTAHLSAEAKGIYGELLDHIYSTHNQLPLDPEEIYRLAGARTASECKSTDRVLREFFVKGEEGYINERAAEEIARRETYVNAQRDRANMRWAPPEPKPKKTSPRGNGLDPEAFDLFWLEYPRKVSKIAAQKAWASTVKVDDLAPLMAAIAAQSATWGDPKFIAHPATWIGQRRWEDETTAHDYGRCAYCAEPATKITNDVAHCARLDHLDFAIARRR